MQFIGNRGDRNVAGREVGTDNGHNAFLFDQTLVSGYRVIRCAFAVQTDDLNFTAEDAAFCIDHFSSQVQTVQPGLAPQCRITGKGTDITDFDRIFSKNIVDENKRKNQQNNCKQQILLHDISSIRITTF